VEGTQDNQTLSSEDVARSPSWMQLMNMAGVVAGPKRATLVPRVAMPVAMAGAKTGPVSLGSLPTCRHVVA